MEKKMLSAQETKKAFIDSISHWLDETLDRRGKSEYKECFKREGSSIFCNLPSDYFNLYNIPDGIRIEMKFVVKK